jgi:protein-S-isoprenylcysteine O-methyltransferase Ste14
VCIVAALLLVGSALGLFRLAGTNPLPMRPTTSLVVRGPYRLTRNPMYLGLALLYAGLALLFDLGWALVLIPVLLFVVHTQIVASEERYLEATFDDEYRAYRTRVRRWL